MYKDREIEYEVFDIIEDALEEFVKVKAREQPSGTRMESAYAKYAIDPKSFTLQVSVRFMYACHAVYHIQSYTTLGYYTIPTISLPNLGSGINKEDFIDILNKKWSRHARKVLDVKSLGGRQLIYEDLPVSNCE